MRTLAMTLLAATPAQAAVTNLEFLEDFSQTRRFLSGRPVGARLLPDNKTVLFLRAQPRSPEQQLLALDVETGAVRELLTPQALLNGAQETLSVEEKARLERQRVTARGFISFKLSDDGARLLTVLSGKPYVYELASGKVTALETGPGAALDPQFSPDGSHVAYVREHDVYAIDLATNVEKAVTTGGTAAKPHGLAEFVAQEEMGRFSGFWWSPDSKSIAWQETDHAGVEQFSVNDPLHPEAQAERFFYPRPGKANAVVRLAVSPVTGGKPHAITWDAKAFPYLATVRWSKGAPLTLVVQSRAQTALQVLKADVASGKTTLLLEEKDAAWLNLVQEFPSWLSDGSAFFWATERTGFTTLELRGKDGALKSTWLGKEHRYLTNIEKGAPSMWFDEPRRTLWYASSPDPKQVQWFKLKEGGAPEPVQQGEGPQNATLRLFKSNYLVSASSATALPHTTLYSLEGKKLAELPSVAEEPKLKLHLEFKSVAGMEGAVLRPENFKPGTKYPVVLQVYGGPAHLEVLAAKRENLLLQWLANQGFVVVKFDGRGTPRKGRDWERAIQGDFATVPMEDQLKALAALGAQLPELDLKRVGVYGWSFGGYLAALLTMARPEAIKSGVAGAPVVDWLDYDTHYTERYLGVPPAADAAYAKSSLLTYVPQAKRPLLLIHGTADDNVYFTHTLKLSDALFKAGKPHSVLPLANFTHMVPDPLVNQRLWERIATFFQETL
jgi:dipeptidyl-peptidase 4